MNDPETEPTFEVFDYAEVPSKAEASPAVRMAQELIAGMAVFVPKGGPIPTLYLINEAGRLRRQRKMVRNGVEGTAYWAVMDDREHGLGTRYRR